MAPATKKSVAIQARRRPSPDVALISGGSGAGVIASSASQAPPMVVPMPSVEQADVGAQGAPSEVVEQPVMATIPLLMAPTVAGATQLVMTRQCRWTWRRP